MLLRHFSRRSPRLFRPSTPSMRNASTRRSSKKRSLASATAAAAAAAAAETTNSATTTLVDDDANESVRLLAAYRNRHTPRRHSVSSSTHIAPTNCVDAAAFASPPLPSRLSPPAIVAVAPVDAISNTTPPCATPPPPPPSFSATPADSSTISVVVLRQGKSKTNNDNAPPSPPTTMTTTTIGADASAVALRMTPSRRHPGALTSSALGEELDYVDLDALGSVDAAIFNVDGDSDDAAAAAVTTAAAVSAVERRGRSLRRSTPLRASVDTMTSSILDAPIAETTPAIVRAEQQTRTFNSFFVEAKFPNKRAAAACRRAFDRHRASRRLS